MPRDVLHARVPRLGAVKGLVAPDRRAGHGVGEDDAGADGGVLEGAEAAVPLGGGACLLPSSVVLFAFRGHVHAAEVLGVEVLAVKDVAVGEVFPGGGGGGGGGGVAAAAGDAAGQRVCGDGRGPVGEARALGFLADPVVQEEVLGLDVALPFVLGGELGAAAGKVEDALEGARVLLLGVRVEGRLVRVDLLGRAAGLAAEELALVGGVGEAVGGVGWGGRDGGGCLAGLAGW